MSNEEELISTDNFALLVMLVLWVISWIITAGLGTYVYLSGGLNTIWGYDSNQLMCILMTWSLLFTIVVVIIGAYKANRIDNEEYINKVEHTGYSNKHISRAKLKYLTITPLVVLVVVVGLTAYTSWRGKLTHQDTDQVKIMYRLPYSNPTFNRAKFLVTDIKSNKDITIVIKSTIADYLSKGDIIDVTKKVYSKGTTISDYYSAVEFDEQGKPIYNIANAKKHEIIPLKATITDKKEITNYRTDAHGITTSSYNYTITFKYTGTSKIETREVAESFYNSCYKGQEIVINEHIYTLKNNIKVTKYIL